MSSAPMVSTHTYMKDRLTRKEMAKIFSNTAHGINGLFRCVGMHPAGINF